MGRRERELPHQSANCARIYEEEFLIPIYNLVYQSVTHNNSIIDTTTSTDGTTSAPSSLTASPDIRKKKGDHSITTIYSSLSLMYNTKQKRNLKIHKRADTMMELLSEFTLVSTLKIG